MPCPCLSGAALNSEATTNTTTPSTAAVTVVTDPSSPGVLSRKSSAVVVHLDFSDSGSRSGSGSNPPLSPTSAALQGTTAAQPGSGFGTPLLGTGTADAAPDAGLCRGMRRGCGRGTAVREGTWPCTARGGGGGGDIGTGQNLEWQNVAQQKCAKRCRGI